MKKCLLIAVMALAVATVVMAAPPVDLHPMSKFKNLDPKAINYKSIRAHLCTTLVRDIRTHTMQLSEVREAVEHSAEVSQCDRDKYNALKKMVEFENSDYAANCMEQPLEPIMVTDPS